MFKNSAGFNKSLERATSNLLLDPDWDAILGICDSLRQGDVDPKVAVQGIKKRLQDKNPHVVLFTLQLLDAVVKNCGKPVHDEVITTLFMEDLETIAKKGPEDVRNRVLEIVQCWAHGFREKPQYRAVQDKYNEMKMSGYKFPVMKEADALFVAESAPDWVEGDKCHRCRDEFSLLNRRHHCRNCGQIFCNKCSAKVSALPKYGIEKEVRVCDPCYESINVTKISGSATLVKKADVGEKENDLPVEYLNSSLSKEPQAPVKKTAEEIQEEEELQLALAMSQSEAEAKSQKVQNKSWASVAAPKSALEKHAEPPSPQTNGSSAELDKYLNRQFWEDKQKETSAAISVAAPYEPSAPTPSSTPSIIASENSHLSRVHEGYQNGENDEIQHFMNALKTQINVFKIRMQSNVKRGRPFVNDPTIISLFNNLLPMRQQLLEYTQAQDHWKEYYERLQEKLTRLKEAREALDVLREEHRDKIRQEAEERHRVMQMQMMAKLDSLRMKKREYLEYQRQMAYQQMQAQEQELQRRKQIYQPYSYVPAYASGSPGGGAVTRQGGPVPGYAGPIPMAPPGYAPSTGTQSHPNQQIYHPIPQQVAHPAMYYGGQGQPAPGYPQQQSQPVHDFQYPVHQSSASTGSNYVAHPLPGHYAPYPISPQQSPQQQLQQISQNQSAHSQQLSYQNNATVPQYHAIPSQTYHQQPLQQQQQQLPMSEPDHSTQHTPQSSAEEPPLISFD